MLSQRITVDNQELYCRNRGRWCSAKTNQDEGGERIL